ncbi:hypothetical protein RZE82_09485 [Mollicutes bacterium LVI A0039]|nr:hypothetical protein RZE82_09485 [Mollicutes bacterium LVI A0039]
MSKMSTASLGAGIVAGMVTIYAVRNGIDNETINAKVERVEKELNLIVEDLIKLGRDALERIYNAIVVLVKKIVYKMQVILQDYQLRGA